MSVTRYMQTFTNKDGSTETVLDPIQSNVCAWDGETKLSDYSVDIFSDHARKNYDDALEQMGIIMRNIQEDKDFMEQFSNREEFAEYIVFETLVRLASPITGEIYGSIAPIRQELGFRHDIIKNVLNTLDSKGMIDLYPNVNRNNKVARLLPCLRIMDTDKCDYEQAIVMVG